MSVKPPCPSRTHRDRPPSPPTDLPYLVRAAGRIDRQPMHSTAGTHHGDAMLTLVLAGTGRYLQAGREAAVAGGMIGLVLPGGDVGVLMADADDPYDHYYCRFAGTEAMHVARRLRAEPMTSAFGPCPGFEEVGEGFGRLIGAWGGRRRSNPDRLAACDALLAYVLALLDRREPPVGRAGRLSRDGLLRYLRDHLAEPADLSRVGEAMGVSRPHLCRRGKQLLGETVLSAWRRMKLDWAKILLRREEFTVADVARRVGYPDAQYFSKVFSRHVGTSPAAFRRASAPR